jgi:hypothetical protein
MFRSALIPTVPCTRRPEDSNSAAGRGGPGDHSLSRRLECPGPRSPSASSAAEITRRLRHSTPAEAELSTPGRAAGKLEEGLPVGPETVTETQPESWQAWPLTDYELDRATDVSGH